MSTTINKNTQYTDKNFFVNRITKITNTSVKSEIASKVNLLLTTIKSKF